MANTFLIADNHFGHRNLLTFKRADGSPLRTFDSIEEMDEHMVSQWNKTVSIQDKVYMLGDMVMVNKSMPILGRLNGTKILIKGNHDIFKPQDYLKYVKDIRAYHKLDSFYLSHIPIHPNSLPGWLKANIHGHLHYQHVMKKESRLCGYGQDSWYEDFDVPDERYYCVSVEHLDDYKPVSFDVIRKKYNEQN